MNRKKWEVGKRKERAMHHGIIKQTKSNQKYASPITLLIHIIWVSYLKTKNNDLLTPVKQRFNLFLS
jgi:hypothetical protein